MKGKVFSEALFNAVIQGRKTQFRELVKPQPYTCGSCYLYVKSDCEYIGGGKFCYRNSCEKNNSDLACHHYEEYYHPRFKVGDTVFLREPYTIAPLEEESRKFYPHLSDCIYKYSSNKNPEVLKYLREKGYNKVWNETIKWKNKLSMRAEHARFFIRILSVKCERIQGISNSDCEKSGIWSTVTGAPPYELVFRVPNCPTYYYTPQQAYAYLVNCVLGRGTWESNQYVFVYDFELINKPFDQILEDNKDIKRLKNK